MVCSEFAVLRKTILRNWILRKTKKYLLTYLQVLFPQYTLYPPVQKHSGPEKISRKHIYTEDKKKLSGPTGTPAKGNIFTMKLI